MEVNKCHQIKPVSKELQYYEAEEGGLDLVNFQDTIILRIIVGDRNFSCDLIYDFYFS